MALLDVLYSDFNGGISATFTKASGGTPSSVTILIDEDPQREDSGALMYEALITVRQAEVSARPVYRDQFATVDGAGTAQTWSLIEDAKELRELREFGGEWECKVNRDVKPTFRR